MANSYNKTKDSVYKDLKRIDKPNNGNILDRIEKDLMTAKI